MKNLTSFNLIFSSQRVFDEGKQLSPGYVYIYGKDDSWNFICINQAYKTSTGKLSREQIQQALSADISELQIKKNQTYYINSKQIGALLKLISLSNVSLESHQPSLLMKMN